MNNYENMNYGMPMYTPNGLIYVQNMAKECHMPKEHIYHEQYKECDMKLKEKLSKQAGDNMAFNKPNYMPKVNPTNLYDVYNGFIRGNMFPDLYNGYKIPKPFEIKPMNEQAELLTCLDAYSFAAHDINLYLDTNPDDHDMLNLYKMYAEEAEKVTNEYENKYGPLNVHGSKTCPWAWNESPWPWENKEG